LSLMAPRLRSTVEPTKPNDRSGCRESREKLESFQTLRSFERRGSRAHW
jgi:hypothetical protein